MGYFMNKNIKAFLTAYVKCQHRTHYFCKQSCGHDVPQYNFIYNSSSQNISHHNRLVRWVLHFETLQTEFNALMSKYGLEKVVRLPENAINVPTFNRSMTRLTKANLTSANRRLI